MFDAAGTVGGLSVQLVYFRGIGESRASPFVANARALRDLMVKIDCRGGHTQIRKVLAHVRREAEKRPVAALAYVGDAMEENPDELRQLAGEIGLLGVRAFMFHEGREPAAERTFREIARLTGGAYLPFDRASAAQLRALLNAVATYAAGGLKALQASRSAGAQLLLPAAEAMTIVLGLVAGLGVVALLLAAFLKTPPADLAHRLRLAAGIALLVAGGGLLLVGRFALALPLGFAGFMILRREASMRHMSPSGQQSSVRSAGLDMALDHETGEMDGQVLAGRHEGRTPVGAQAERASGGCRRFPRRCGFATAPGKLSRPHAARLA